MVTIKGTETEVNLLKSFAGESQARCRYTYYAEVARAEGYEQIAAVFLETAEQEREHAKVFYKYLQGGELTITAPFRAGVIGSTRENLLAAAEGEREEWSVLYSQAEQVARGEGFAVIADSFREISLVEIEHEKRYLRLLSRFNDNDFFHRDEDIWWQCRNCGYVLRGVDAPHICPACKHAKAFFEPMRTNY